jgi:FKBP-type peptidyl-prolyl cis-trans isomerase 2
MRNAALAALSAAFLLTAACRRDASVHAGDTVEIFYEMTVDGAVRESNFGGKPAEVTQGGADLPSGLDAALIGMSPGEEKRLTLTPAQAFGEHDPAKVQTIPLSKFGSLAKEMKPGKVVQGFRNGKAQEGVVLSMSGGQAVLDFNDPLAGKTVSYRVQVVSTAAPE